MRQRIHDYGPLHAGTLVKRYQRFLADVRMPDGRVVTAFTPNSGSMKTCSDPGSEVMLSHDPKPGRKTEFNLEMVRSGPTWVGVNTLLANRLASSLIDRDLTGEESLRGFRVRRREYVYGDSRLDILVEREGRSGLVEVKNVTLRDRDAARFPDAVTSRGRKHLTALVRAAEEGYAAFMIYTVQRADCRIFGPARDIDPDYTESFHRALETGVTMVPCLLDISPTGIDMMGRLPLEAVK